jgi:8-oxo-dGTP pyrophosphatase MutT (NUDIX family)
MRTGADVTRPRVRDAARVIVLDDAGRVLLTRFEFRDGVEVWTTVGGGVEPGETHEEAARRELVEEAGLSVDDVGPCVWTRDHVIPDPISFDVQRERFFLVRTTPFEPRPRLSWDDLNAEGMTAIRWWTVDEIDGARGTRFGPRRLGTLLRELIERGPPPEPLDAGE